MKYFATKISDNLSRTPEGFLLCVGVSIARTGEMEYGEGETPLKTKNGLVVVTRSEAEVFSKECIASFEGKCFTVGHPEEFVNSDNFEELSTGHIQNVRRGSGEQANDLVADVLIKDANTISLVEDGKRGLSCGYEAEYIQLEDGLGEQRKIRGNHLALVDEGRAGQSYQINDHKGDDFMKKFTKVMAENFKAVFGKTVDAMTDVEAKKDDKAPAKDEDSQAYDAIVKMCDDMSNMIKGMAKKSGDADPEKKEAPKNDEKKEAGDEEVESGVEARLKAMEEKLDAFLEAMSGEEEAGDEGGEDLEDTGDADPEDKEKTGDEEETLVGATGDSARAEILAPGIKVLGKSDKTLKVRALKAAYKTADGKKVIDGLTGGKPLFDNSAQTEMLFIASSEMLKEGRSNGELASHAKARVNDFKSSIFPTKETMTPEKINEMNAAHYAKK